MHLMKKKTYVYKHATTIKNNWKIAENFNYLVFQFLNCNKNYISNSVKIYFIILD